MRRIGICLAAALCILLASIGAAAQDNYTRLTAEVPDQHIITIECGAGGSLRINGRIYTGNAEVPVERLGTVIIEILTDEGYQAASVTVEPENGVTVEGGKVILSEVYEDKKLTVGFVKNQEKPQETEDSQETEENGSREETEDETRTEQEGTEQNEETGDSKQTEESEQTAKAAQTGDGSRAGLWLMLCLISGITIWKLAVLKKGV